MNFTTILNPTDRMFTNVCSISLFLIQILIGALLDLLIGILIPLKLNLGCFKISNKKIDNSYQEVQK